MGSQDAPHLQGLLVGGGQEGPLRDPLLDGLDDGVGALFDEGSRGCADVRDLGIRLEVGHHHGPEGGREGRGGKIGTRGRVGKRGKEERSGVCWAELRTEASVQIRKITLVQCAITHEGVILKTGSAERTVLYCSHLSSQRLAVVPRKHT